MMKYLKNIFAFTSTALLMNNNHYNISSTVNAKVFLGRCDVTDDKKCVITLSKRQEQVKQQIKKKGQHLKQYNKKQLVRIDENRILVINDDCCGICLSEQHERIQQQERIRQEDEKQRQRDQKNIIRVEQQRIRQEERIRFEEERQRQRDQENKIANLKGLGCITIPNFIIHVFLYTFNNYIPFFQYNTLIKTAISFGVWCIIMTSCVYIFMVIILTCLLEHLSKKIGKRNK